jgi:hypothetical protein
MADDDDLDEPDEAPDAPGTPDQAGALAGRTDQDIVAFGGKG